jgi:hypothetical protein
VHRQLGTQHPGREFDRLEYQVRENAFASFDPANTDPRSLVNEVSAAAKCPAADYSYTLPVKRPNQDAAQNSSPGAAQQSSARDSLYRGWQYQVGEGVPKDAATAARLYAEAARAGLPEAMYRLAFLYADGNGVSRDPAAAVSWFYQAAKQGHAAAQMELGFAFLLGNGDSSKTNAVIGVAATVIVGAMLLSFLSRSGSGDSAVAPPSASSSWPGSDTSTSDSRPPPPPAPHCHEAPVEDPFTIRAGVYTLHGGSTLVCD